MSDNHNPEVNFELLSQTSITQTALAPNEKATKKRFGILALIFISVVINYMDRTNISVAASALSEELSLSAIQMGLIFSAFGWTYSVMQVPGGMAADFLKIRILYPFILIAWSLATLVQGLVSSFTALIGCRMVIGVFEAPSYPCNNKIVTTWFPESERASAIATYTSAQFIGLAFLMPVLVLIQEHYTWRGLFIISGLIGIVWALIWYFIYRDPQDHKTINQAELDYIGVTTAQTPDVAQQKQSTANKQAQTVSTTETILATDKGYVWRDVRAAFSSKKLWGVYLGQFCLGGTTMFFLTWFPTYLVEYRGLDFIKSGFLAAIPFIGAFCGVLISGFLSDYLTRIGISKEFSRKAPVITGMFLSMFIIGANYTDDTFWIVTFLSIAFFGNGLASITWVFVSLLAPKKMIGLVGGCMNGIGALSAVSVPIIIGFLVNDGDFKPALLFIGFLALLGMCAYIFLVGKIERVNLNSQER